MDYLWKQQFQFLIGTVQQNYIKKEGYNHEKFQFLIGTVQLIWCMEQQEKGISFQFLIGTVQQIKYQWKDGNIMFQFLIGTVQQPQTRGLQIYYNTFCPFFNKNSPKSRSTSISQSLLKPLFTRLLQNHIFSSPIDRLFHQIHPKNSTFCISQKLSNPVFISLWRQTDFSPTIILNHVILSNINWQNLYIMVTLTHIWERENNICKR